MKLIGLVFIGAGILLIGCPKPAPVPVTPTDLTCAVDQATHDNITDGVVTALQDGTSLAGWVSTYGKTTVTCIVQEIVIDVHGAPTLIDRAQAWLAAEGS